MNLYLKVFEPEEVGEFYTHWPELDKNKINRISRRQTRGYKLHNGPTSKQIQIFDTNPLIIAPFSDGHMVLNGKHRSYLTFANGYKCLSHIVYTTKDIQNRLSKASLGNLTKEEILRTFMDMHKYHKIAKKTSRTKIKHLDINFCLLN